MPFVNIWVERLALRGVVYKWLTCSKSFTHAVSDPALPRLFATPSPARSLPYPRSRLATLTSERIKIRLSEILTGPEGVDKLTVTLFEEKPWMQPLQHLY